MEDCAGQWTSQRNAAVKLNDQPYWHRWVEWIFLATKSQGGRPPTKLPDQEFGGLRRRRGLGGAVTEGGTVREKKPPDGGNPSDGRLTWEEPGEWTERIGVLPMYIGSSTKLLN